MRKDLQLLLRDIAISQGHISLFQRDELVIYFFQEPSYLLEDAFRIFVTMSELEILIYFSFQFNPIKITKFGEEKITRLFKTFLEQSAYKGVVKFSPKADENKYDLEYSFLEFLNSQIKLIQKDDLKLLSSLLTFTHRISTDFDFTLEDLTNVLSFLNISSTIRSLSDGKLMFLQRYDEQFVIFDSINDFAGFLNQCYQEASFVKHKWEQILDNEFSHTFRLEGQKLAFSAGYYITNVNQQYFRFLDSVEIAKNVLSSFCEELKMEFEHFLSSSPEVFLENKEINAIVVPSLDSLDFQLLKLNALYLNKKYTLELSFNSMMDGICLKIGNSTFVYNLNDFEELENELDEIKRVIKDYFQNLYFELTDSINVIQKVQKFDILDYDISFISLVGPDLYRFIHLPKKLNTFRFIETEPSFTNKSYSKEEFLNYLVSLIKLDEMIRKQMFSIISYINFLRLYDSNQLYFALCNGSLFLVGTKASYPCKFKVKYDGNIEFLIQKGGPFFIEKEYTYPISIQDFYRTSIKAIEVFENQTILSQIFAVSSEEEASLLSHIFARFSVSNSILYHNNTPYSDDELAECLESIIIDSKIENVSQFDLFEFDVWQSKMISQFVQLFKNKSISVTYDTSLKSFFIY